MAAEDRDRVVRIATWNLWWRFGGWEQRLDAIAAVMAEVDADIWTLQEVWAGPDGSPNQAELLAGPLGMRWDWAPYGGLEFWQRRAEPDSTDALIGTAVLSRWPLGLAVHDVLPTVDDVPGRGPIHVVSVAHPSGPVSVVTTHLSSAWARSDLRQLQLGAVVDVLGRADDEARLTVVTGDFNAPPVAEEIRRLAGWAPAYEPGTGLIDAWEYLRPDDRGATWVRRNPHVQRHREPDLRIDYLFLAPPFPEGVGEPLRVEVIGDAPVEGVWPSDHFGVVADLRIRPAPSSSGAD
ncbi:MAG: endonuclease/exonuclease/phosphatase family protein [Actinomycetota bacterium]